VSDELGLTLGERQALMGHADARMTMHYTDADKASGASNRGDVEVDHRDGGQAKLMVFCPRKFHKEGIND
jgi:hypothetical protein